MIYDIRVEGGRQSDGQAAGATVSFAPSFFTGAS
jgi:hypothetical protein